MAFVVRTERTDPLELVGPLREAVWSVNRNLPLADVGPLTRLVERDMAATTFTLSMLLAAAGVAVLLGAIGIYGVIAYVFEQRTREIGIRVALGATRRDVLAMVLRQGAIIAALGVAVGVVAAAAMTRLLASQVFGVGTLDLTTYAAAVTLVGGIALVASYVPARRAAQADPRGPLQQ
jgi:ABC-type antimicrobial peptide transport system permease subunit